MGMKIMKKIIFLVISMFLGTASLSCAAGDYRGDKRCPPPKDWSRYSEPYDPRDHENDYPTFEKADKPGWACSYQREDGVIVQYGDSRTPQEQWIFYWGGSKPSDH
jgi:hypothetical protein